MTNCLFFSDDASHNEEIISLFNRAGYQVVAISDAAACCRHLERSAHVPKGQTSPTIPGPVPPLNALTQGTGPMPDYARHGITIFTPKSYEPDIATVHQSGLSACILSLARHLVPGWHVSLRRRCLEGPNAQVVDLTSLEFTLIKIFTMVEMGESVSRKIIVQEFGEDYLSYDQNRLDTLVRRLRKKVQQQIGLPLPLKTVRVRGFAFDERLIIER